MSAALTFEAGAARRVVAACAVVVGALIALLLVERLDDPAVASILDIDATAAVTAWSVRIDGREVVADGATATTWHGRLPAGTGAIAISASGSDRHASIALRARLQTPAGATAHLAWGEGDVALAIDARPEHGRHHD